MRHQQNWSALSLGFLSAAANKCGWPRMLTIPDFEGGRRKPHILERLVLAGDCEQDYQPKRFWARLS
jgi:hypothetical protein